MPQPDGGVAAEVGGGLSNEEARLFFGSLGSYLGRYVLTAGPAIHKSSTSMVHFANDLKTGSATCCVKMMKNRDQFEAEILGRSVDGVPLSTADVIGVLGFHTPESEPFADAATSKAQELEATSADDKYSYVLVMEKGERSLHDACDKERIAGYDLDAIRKAMIDTLTKLQHLHEAGVVHGDLKQRTILRSSKGDWIVCDMDAASRVGAEIGSKSSSAYGPPELAKKKYTDSGTKVLEHAETSFDVWSAGVILYELTAGHKLFAQDTANDELVEMGDKTRLCVWNTITDDELAPVFASGEIAQLIADVPELKQMVDDAKNLIR